jgi:diadenosine tetraphosphate (Ap4A) HIT family hydrolase
MFVLDPALDAVTSALVDLPLCQARRFLDGRFPWLLLVPRVAGAREIEDLAAADRTRLVEEAVAAGAAVRAMGAAFGRPVEKLNIAALGNVTPQLHVHVVGRRRDDAAWPGPVWGHGAPTAYDPGSLAAALAAARAALEG